VGQAHLQPQPHQLPKPPSLPFLDFYELIAQYGGRVRLQYGEGVADMDHHGTLCSALRHVSTSQSSQPVDAAVDGYEDLSGMLDDYEMVEIMC